ncbi:MAG: phasin family protein [Burkholderiales bacterium]|nr:phasin family protein [Burkholderiales bacterium]
MDTKGIKQALDETRKGTQSVLDSAHQIWLAGLGAFAMAQEEGGKLFDNLVKQGEQLEKRTRKIASERLQAVTSQTSGSWDKLEQVFEDRVSRSLNRLGVPTKKDIDHLSKRVAELSTAVNALVRKQGDGKAQRPARASRPAS